VAVVLLVPWKSMIVRRGLRRARRSRWVSLLLAALAVTALLTGLGSASGLLRYVGGFRGMWLHVAAALALLPLVVWAAGRRRRRRRASSRSKSSPATTRPRATLYCTSGWYAHQDWEGVPVAALVRNTGAAWSLHVHSTRRPCSRTARR
jgi:4-amino-4-deoxy-L-arabinose transferase-like glycosyltransferase